MAKIEYSQVKRRPGWRRWVVAVALTVIALSLVTIVILLVSMKLDHSSASSWSTGTPISRNPAKSEKFDADGIYDARVKPVLAHLQAENSAACQRAIGRVHDRFEKARNGAGEFAEAIIGPGDAIKTAYLASKDMYWHWREKNNDSNEIARHVQFNYEKYVISGPGMEEVVRSSLEQLKQDFRANRNESLQAISSSLQTANLPADLKIDAKEQEELEQLCGRAFDEAIKGINNGHISQKAAAGSAAAFALSNIATAIVARTITMAIVKAGGAVATSTTGGAGAGTVAEPGLGTVIGAASGLLAGVAVDVWVSHKDKVATVQQVKESLDQIETMILEGDDQQRGLKRLLEEATLAQSRTLAEKLQSQIAEAAR